MDPTVWVAGIAAVGSIVTTVLARSNRKQVATRNGHTLGQVVESIGDDLKVLQRQFVSHLEDSDIHQKPPTTPIILVKED